MKRFAWAALAWTALVVAFLVVGWLLLNPDVSGCPAVTDPCGDPLSRGLGNWIRLGFAAWMAGLLVVAVVSWRRAGT